MDLKHEESFKIRKDDKFFSWLVSKESSTANQSFRVYYGGASGSVPFLWESQPGTPKHTSASTTLPPLTPPPSYFARKQVKKKTSKVNLIAACLPKLSSLRKSSSLSSFSSSSPSSSSSSASNNYFSPPTGIQQSRSPYNSDSDDGRSPTCYASALVMRTPGVATRSPK